MKVTQAQLDALYKVYLRWQDKTPHTIMPEAIKIVPEEDYKDGDYIGIWVGGDPMDKGSMYLGIEKDGYTHS